MDKMMIFILTILLYCSLTTNAVSGKYIPIFRKDYTFYEDVKQFYKLHTEETDYQNADLICFKESASRLAYWKTLEEKSIIMKISKRNIVWIGVEMKGGEIYTNYGDLLQKYRSIGENDMYGIGNYQQYTSTERLCVDKLNINKNCQGLRAFICKKDIDPLAVVDISFNKSIPFFRKDYTYLKKNDYFLKKHDAKTWNVAMSICEEENAEMLAINQGDDVSVLTSMLIPGEKFWVGASDLLVNGDYETIHGNALNNNTVNATEGHCLTIDNEGHYESSHCYYDFMFVCQKKSSFYKYECDTLDIGYQKVLGKNKCVKYHNIPKTWHGALELCKIENATLFIINYKGEADLLNVKMKSLETPFGIYYDQSILHVGFHDLFIEGIYRTVDGGSLKEAGYVEWSQFYPKPFTGQRCGAMVRGGTIQNGGCDVPAMFACQKKSQTTFVWLN